MMEQMSKKRIPDGWEVKPLNQILSLFGRIGFRGYNVTDLVQEGKGAITLSPSNIENGIVTFNKCTYLSWEKYEESPEIMIEEGDILLVKTGSTYGKIGYVESLPWPSTINPQYVVLKKFNCNSRLLAYLLGQKEFQDQIESITSGGAIPTMSQAKIYNCTVTLPSDKDEQTRIATALSDMDELIATLKKLIEKKRNIKQGAMQELLTGKRRLPGFTDKWVEKKVGIIGNTYNGLSGKSKEDFGVGESQYITFLNVLNNPVIDTSIFEQVNILPNERQNKAIQGDIFFNTSSETPEEVGICSYLDNEIDNLYLNSFCFGFRITDSEVDGHFLAYFWRSRRGREIMTMLAQGSTRFNLSKSLFKESSILIPPTKKEQIAIVNVISDMDSEISMLESRLTKYLSLKQGMMQQLLTGKIRLI